MQLRGHVCLLLASLSLTSLALLMGCGSSSTTTKTQQSIPVFTSTPVTMATQGVTYTYQLTVVDTAGGTVAFSLTTSPAGAALSGSTISWTPTPAQSRTSNSFAVTATTSSGGTASQQWSVTPGGTITVNWVNTYWTAGGQVQVPALPSAASGLSAMWTNADGSVTLQKSSAISAGVFNIPNVPGGYYWLQSGSGEAFWTNTNTFDLGGNIAGAPLPTTGNTQITQFDFNLSGLDSVPELTAVEFVAPVAGLPDFLVIDGVNSTSITNSPGFGAIGIDWSQINSAFLVQYVPESVGSLNTVVLGPSLTATGLTLVDGTTNTITETLQPSPQISVNLSVPGGSQWAPLFTNVGPSTPTPYDSVLSVAAETYITDGLASSTQPPPVETGPNSPYLTLAGTAAPGSLNTAVCDLTGFQVFVNNTPAQPAITTDENFGELTYGDSFPAAWSRTLSLCQEYHLAIPIPNSSATATFALVDGAIVAPSSAPLAPVVSQVQNPSINGASFFTAATLNTTVVPLSWSAPAGAAPYGYTVHVYVLTTVEGLQSYVSTGGTVSTAQTSINLPPLAGGNTYVFAVTAEADGTANMQTSPFRSSLPVGYATVVSAPITINADALMPEIHGDRRVIARFSQPLPADKKN